MRSPTTYLGILEYYQIFYFDERARLGGETVDGDGWQVELYMDKKVDGVSTIWNVIKIRGTWLLRAPVSFI